VTGRLPRWTKGVKMKVPDDVIDALPPDVAAAWRRLPEDVLGELYAAYSYENHSFIGLRVTTAGYSTKIANPEIARDIAILEKQIIAELSQQPDLQMGGGS
jgi:hypothetical protein